MTKTRIGLFALILAFASLAFDVEAATVVTPTAVAKPKTCGEICMTAVTAWCKENPGEQAWRICEGACLGNQSSGGVCAGQDCVDICQKKIGGPDYECPTVKAAPTASMSY